MKRKKKIHCIPPLSPDASDDEIIRWTETYDIGARLDAGVSEIVEDHSDLDQLLEEFLSSKKRKGAGKRLTRMRKR